MTEREKLKQDIKDGKVSMEKLYKEYDLYMPYFMSYKEFKEAHGEMTIEEYNERIFNNKIEFLLMHMFPEEE